MIEEIKAEIEDAKEYTKHHKRKVRDGLLIALFGFIAISGGILVGKKAETKKEPTEQKTTTTSINLEEALGSSKYTIVENQDLNISEDVYNKIKDNLKVQTSSIYTLEDEDNNYQYIFLETATNLYIFDSNGKELYKTTDTNYSGIKNIYEYEDSYYVEYHSYDKTNCTESINLINITNNKTINLYNIKYNNCQ